MLEILLLFSLGRKIGATVRKKGRRAGGYQLLLVLFWFGGEILGAILGLIASVILERGEEPNFLVVWGSGLVGAIAGAVAAFAIANHVEPLEDKSAKERFEDYGDEPEEPRFRPADERFEAGGRSAPDKPNWHIEEDK